MSKYLVGQLLFDDRKEKGMTLKEYAENLDISTSYLSDIEQGRRLVFPELSSFNRVLNHLGYRAKIVIEELEE